MQDDSLRTSCFLQLLATRCSSIYYLFVPDYCLAPHIHSSLFSYDDLILPKAPETMSSIKPGKENRTTSLCRSFCFQPIKEQPNFETSHRKVIVTVCAERSFEQKETEKMQRWKEASQLQTRGDTFVSAATGSRIAVNHGQPLAASPNACFIRVA